MSVDINNIVRTVVGGAAVLSITIPLGGLASSVGRLADATTGGVTESTKVTKTMEAYQTLTDELTRPCIEFFVSKPDSKLEREAKNTIDEIMGGEVSHAGVCNYVLGN